MTALEAFVGRCLPARGWRRVLVPPEFGPAAALERHGYDIVVAPPSVAAGPCDAAFAPDAAGAAAAWPRLRAGGLLFLAAGVPGPDAAGAVPALSDAVTRCWQRPRSR